MTFATFSLWVRVTDAWDTLNTGTKGTPTVLDSTLYDPSKSSATTLSDNFIPLSFTKFLWELVSFPGKQHTKVVTWCYIKHRSCCHLPPGIHQRSMGRDQWQDAWNVNLRDESCLFSSSGCSRGCCRHSFGLVDHLQRSESLSTSVELNRDCVINWSSCVWEGSMPGRPDEDHIHLCN